MVRSSGGLCARALPLTRTHDGCRLASGGIGDGKQLAACLALGADGVNMGTRFCVTKVRAPRRGHTRG